MLTFEYDKLDSTNDQTKRLTAEHPGQVVLVTAKEQTAGRGRSGRVWRSPPCGAWFSLAWPTNKQAPQYAQASIVVGAAVLGTIRQMIGNHPSFDWRIKWPNDVLLNGGKVAGVLCEWSMPQNNQTKFPAVLMIGVGINANFDPAQLGHGLRYPATTLSAAIGSPIDLDALISCCVEGITKSMASLEHDGLTPQTIQALESDLAWVNQPISLRVGDRQMTGTCTGLDSLGRLMLKTPRGAVAFDAGEIEQLTAVGV